MKPSYLIGPRHELSKRIRLTRELIVKIMKGDHYPRLSDGIHFFSFIYSYFRYLWSIPDGPVLMVKIWMLFLDRCCERFFFFNQNPIRRDTNHAPILSKKQNIGWF